MTTIETSSVAEAGDSIAIFSNIAQRSHDSLMAASAREIVLDGTLIVSEGERQQYLRIVCSGVVELYGKAGESRGTISLLHPGDSFILAAVVSNAVALMSARALGRTEILHVPANLFRKLLESDHALSRNVTTALAGGFRGMVRNLRDQRLRSTNQRLASYLVRLHRQQGGKGFVTLALRKNLIASLLGMRPASLSRAFAELQALGVKVEQDRVMLIEPEQLESFACLHRRVDETDD